MIYWCYFKNDKCIKNVLEIQNKPLSPMEFVMLKDNGIIRFLCDLPDNFNPVGKTKEELKEYLR